MTTILAGSANRALGAAVAAELGAPLGALTTDRYPDGELRVRLGDGLLGGDVYIIQPTSPPVNEHLVELLIIADACRRACAERITAVVPYVGYARADERGACGEPITARMVADVMQCVGIARVIALDLHAPHVEGFFRAPIENVSAVPLLADTVRGCVDDAAVVVAPNVGRIALATRYATALGLPIAVVHGWGTAGTSRSAAGQHVAGDVDGRRCIIADDIIATGATMAATAHALRAAGALPGTTGVATHGLLLSGAIARMRAAGIDAVLTTNSVLPREQSSWFARTSSIAPMLAASIRQYEAAPSLVAHH
jgi:ribose-phosphate pyrophosphokinase